MSLLPDSLGMQVYRKIDRNIDVEKNQPQYIVDVSNQDLTTIRYTTNNYSDSSINFSFNPVNNSVVMDRLFIMNVKVRYTFTGPFPNNSPIFRENDPLVLLSSADGLRGWGFYNCINSETLKINNASSNMTTRDISYALQRYVSDVMKKEYLSYFPNMSDTYANGSDYLEFGSSRNPNSDFGENGGIQTNGAFNPDIQDLGYTAVPVPPPGNPTQCQQIYDYTWQIPILLSPMDFLSVANNSLGLLYVNNINYYVLLDDLSLSWSKYDNGNQYTLSASIVDVPSLQVTYRKLQPYQTLPKHVMYSYETPISVAKENNIATAAGASSKIVSDVITFNGVPDCIYVYVAQRQQDRTFSSASTAAIIDRISVNLNTRNNLLSDFSKNQLYHIAKKNGYGGCYADFAIYNGGFLKLKFGSDISLIDSLMSSGSNNQMQCQVTVDYTNQGPNQVFALYIIHVSIGVMICYDTSNTVTYTNIVSPSDIINSPIFPDSLLDDLQTKYYGGLSVNDIIKYGKKAYSTVKKGYEKAKPYLEKYAPTALDLAADVGQFAAPRLAPEIQQARSKIKDITGYGFIDHRGKITGGKKASVKKMKQKMLKY